MLYLRRVVFLGLGHLGAHVLVPELAELADGEVLAVAEVGVAGVLPQDVRGQLVGLGQGSRQSSEDNILCAMCPSRQPFRVL